MGSTPAALAASSDLAATANSPLFDVMAEQYKMARRSFVETVIRICFPAKDKDNNPLVVTMPQVAAFLIVAKQYNLNPFTREIFAFVGKGGQVIPVVSLDGWVSLVTNHPQYDGVDFSYEIDNNNGRPISTTCILYRKNTSRPTPITERFAECNRNNDVWNRWPHRMLRHKAYIQAARMAFGFSGIYDEDEGRRILEGDSEISQPLAKPAITMPERVKTIQPVQQEPAPEQESIPDAAQPEEEDLVPSVLVPDEAAKAMGDASPFRLEPPPSISETEQVFLDEKQIKTLLAVARSGRFRGKTEAMAMEKILAHYGTDALNKIKRTDLNNLMTWAAADKLKLT